MIYLSSLHNDKNLGCFRFLPIPNEAAVILIPRVSVHTCTCFPGVDSKKWKSGVTEHMHLKIEVSLPNCPTKERSQFVFTQSLDFPHPHHHVTLWENCPHWGSRPLCECVCLCISSLLMSYFCRSLEILANTTFKAALYSIMWMCPHVFNCSRLGGHLRFMFLRNVIVLCGPSLWLSC